MTRGNQISLAIGGVVVIGLVAGLLIMMNRAPKRHTRGSGAPAGSREAGSGDQPMSREGDVRPIGRRPPGGTATAGGEEPAAERPDAATYLVREHEPGEGPRRPSPISHTTVAQIRAKVQPYIKQCGAPLREADPETRQRIQVTVQASSAGGRVVLHDAVVKGPEAFSADVLECVKRAVEQVSFDAPVGQGDGDQKVHLPFMVP